MNGLRGAAQQRWPEERSGRLVEGQEKNSMGVLAQNPSMIAAATKVGSRDVTRGRRCGENF